MLNTVHPTDKILISNNCFIISNMKTYNLNIVSMSAVVKTTVQMVLLQNISESYG